MDDDENVYLERFRVREGEIPCLYENALIAEREGRLDDAFAYASELLMIWYDAEHAGIADEREAACVELFDRVDRRMRGKDP